jgi:hypothetical protein
VIFHTNHTLSWLTGRPTQDKYHDVILKAERSILLKPNMKTVRGCKCRRLPSGFPTKDPLDSTHHIRGSDPTQAYPGTIVSISVRFTALRP